MFKTKVPSQPFMNRFSRFTQQDVRMGTALNIQLDIPYVHQIRLERPLRIIQGKRMVCRASMGSQWVLVKLYFHPDKAKQNWRKSLSGTQAFVRKKIPTPALIYAGPLADEQSFIIVSEYITQAVRLDEALASASSDEARSRLKKRFTACLARQHEKGLLQRDCHLGNFLISDTIVYSLDGDQIKTRPSPIPFKTSMDNLAGFLACFNPAEDKEVDTLLRAYHDCRKIKPQRSWQRFVSQRVRSSRNKNLKQYLRKIYRNRDPFRVEKTRRFFCVYDQRSWQQEYSCIKDNPLAFFPKNSGLKLERVILQSSKGPVCLYKERSRPQIMFWKSAKTARMWEQEQINHRLGSSTAKPIMFLRVKTGLFSTDRYLLSQPQLDPHSTCTSPLDQKNPRQHP